ncbi:ribosomal RNA processing protein 1 homolog [Venturia canescens]|uniref:ribosomal RNA processing protein 1 homolog n=1 Tax=Venturia canescens TaxID=32260 RepID=UPI001C9C88A3|nr:ribosomal RNA processing protein 1 homolog [Venturia canescens]
MAKKNTRVPRKRSHSHSVEKIVKPEAFTKKVKKRKALVIAQEIKFARLLANNDKKVRDKMLKNLKKWLTVRSESSFAFTEADFMRLWKGLFYCMWMSDKPLVQEELAESLSNIVHCFDSMETALLYTKCTLKTLAIEWFGIDRFRLDKFQMLVRRIIRQTFVMCRLKSWDREWTKGSASIIENILLDPKTCLGFSLHLTELYMEELAKIGGGSILPENVTDLLRPFAIHLASMEDERQIRHVMKHIFRYLIFQSDVGMDYMEKFDAWRQAGFPCKNIDQMQKVELDDREQEVEDESSESVQSQTAEQKPLDPRAGRVDVELPQLPFDPSAIAELLQEYKFNPKSTTKTRRQMMRLIREFSELSKGIMPLGIKEVVLPQKKSSDMNSKKAAYRLLEFEKELHSDTIRRKRKRKQILPIDEDENGEGFENTFTPINEDELETNGFDREEEEEKEEEEDNNEKEFGANDDKNLHKNKKNKQKLKNKFLLESEATNKLAAKKQKKSKKTNLKNVEGTLSITENREDDKQLSVNTNFKLKSKKTKTKKLQNAINYLNKKFLNRSSEDITPTKTKKSRRSIETVWDISNNDDPPTPTMSPTSKPTSPPPKSPPREKTIVNETNTIGVKESSSSLSKEKIKQIPWLHPVLTKLEDENPKFQTPNKTQPTVVQNNSGSSAKKRVKIMLRHNTAQHTSEYIRQLRQSPAIPYDANRKPLSGVLKPSPLSSPVNPFYKKA